MTDEDAVRYLTTHRFFQPHITPLQLFNQATDPFLPSVKPHTFEIATKLDEKRLTNHLLIITRYVVTREDCERLNRLSNLRVTLLITYSGIDDKRVEPIESKIAIRSLLCSFAHAKRYKVVLYWRPIVPGLNDSAHHLKRAARLSRYAHATVFTGLFYREEIRRFFLENNIPQMYSATARRKILPRELEERVLSVFAASEHVGALFRKTSCAVAYAHKTFDYNGHFGIPELCDICPKEQQNRCGHSWKRPAEREVERLVRPFTDNAQPTIDARAVHVEGLSEQQRYFIQHSLGYQVHDRKYPHRPRLHGRADIGWTKGT